MIKSSRVLRSPRSWPAPRQAERDREREKDNVDVRNLRLIAGGMRIKFANQTKPKEITINIRFRLGRTLPPSCRQDHAIVRCQLVCVFYSAVCTTQNHDGQTNGRTDGPYFCCENCRLPFADGPESPWPQRERPPNSSQCLCQQQKQQQPTK